MRSPVPVLLALAAVLLSAAGAAAQSLKISDRQGAKTVTAQQLLADPATRDITIVNDSVFGRAMTYRAIPVADLLKGLAIAREDYVEFVATDRFSIGVPARLLLRLDGTGPHAWLAIEPPGAPWPAIPDHGKETPRPFFLVWQDARPGEVSSEYWVYKLGEVEVTDSPYKRWPTLNVADDVPATDPTRRGLDRYVALCISCHRFKGAGNGDQGPDLGQPMNPVDYFQPQAFRLFLRSSKRVRDWPDRKMPSFTEEVMSNEDMEALIAWLTYKARH
jgi:mono/diheme cytochrome c family protein